MSSTVKIYKSCRDLHIIDSCLKGVGLRLAEINLARTRPETIPHTSPQVQHATITPHDMLGSRPKALHNWEGTQRTPEYYLPRLRAPSAGRRAQNAGSSDKAAARYQKYHQPLQLR
eukprot:987619-Pyramimonas_sp.AAC.1